MIKRTGVVIHGKSLAKKLSAPTLNIRLNRKYIRWGIYSGQIIHAKRRYPAVIHYGPRPALNDTLVVCEAHCLDKQLGNWYGRRVQIEFVHYLRSIRTFPSLAALMGQIKQDIRSARTDLTS